MTSRRLRLAPPPSDLPPQPPAQPPSGTPSFPDPIEGLIPHGSICTLSGASGVGKTAFLASILPTLLTGGELFGHKVNATNVGVLVCDRPWRDHRAWFDKSGLADIPHYSLRDVDYNWLALKDSSRIPALFGQLVDSIKLEPGSLLLVDPLPLFLPGRLMDYKDMAIGFGLLDQQLKPRGITMLGVFHVGKQKAGKQERYTRAQDRILGSTALIGYSETTFYLLSPEESEKATYEFGAISHQAPPIVIDYKRTDNGLFVPANTAEQDLEALDQGEAALRALPDGEPLSSSVAAALVQKALKCSDTTARRYLRTHIREGRITVVARGIIQRAKPA